MDPTSITLPLAVLAGVLSFASPCFLPIVPVYVGYLVGDETSDHRARTAAVQALCFIAGFTVVFVAFWAALGVVGYALGDYRGVLRVLGGVVLIVLGLHVARLLQISTLYRTVRLPIGPRSGQPVHPHPSRHRSALLGVAFAAGWTPCIGPVLGGVIALASTRDSLTEGAVLLLAYSAGLGIPFLLVAIGADRVAVHLRWFTRHDVAVSTVSGAALILIGFGMITDTFGRLAALAPAFGL